MAGRGPAPKDPVDRRRRNVPAGGEWVQLEGMGWQHGDIPRAPAGLRSGSQRAWRSWFRGWWAAHWTEEDLPGLRQVVRLYDAVEGGELQRAPELRLQMDTYGLTPKGRQSLHWKKPEESTQPQRTRGTRYVHLRAVEEG